MVASWEYRNSKNTPYKQLSFEAAVDLWCCVYREIKKNNSKWIKTPLWYIDLNAGKGVDDDGLDGSALIFLRKVEEYGLDYRAYLYELNWNHADQLHATCWERGYRNFEVFRADNRRVLLDFPKPNSAQYGIIYSDVSNAPAIQLHELTEMNKHFPKLDTMINLAFGSYKRTIKQSDYIPLYNALPSIKRIWKVRKPRDKMQWSILLGLNWGKYPNQTAWGFHDLRSVTGRYYWELITKTKGESDEDKQLPLWGDNNG